MEMPPTLYAKSGDVHIAYAQAGEGEDVLVTPGSTSAMWLLWPLPWFQDLLPRTRVTVYDKRGTGASDPLADFTFEERMDDIRAVMDAAGIRKAHLIGMSEGGPMSLLFAATYPDRVKSLTLYGTFASWMRRADYPWGMALSLHAYMAWVDRIMSAVSGNPEDARWFLSMFRPSVANDAGVEAFVTSRRGASPGQARAIWEGLYEIDVRHVLAAIGVPTIIVHIAGDRVSPVGGGEYLARHIPGAELVLVLGDDHMQMNDFPEFSSAIFRNIERARERTDLGAERRLATVLFTDIVDSTPTAVQSGDQAWRDTLDRHDSASVEIVRNHQGVLVKSTGDGILATFDGPSRAVRCAAALHSRMRELGIPIRAGMHAGEIELRGADIAGIGVNIAARIAALAGAGETLVSSTVKDLTAGAGFTFRDHGSFPLKGVPDEWRLYLAVG